MGFLDKIKALLSSEKSGPQNIKTSSQDTSGPETGSEEKMDTGSETIVDKAHDFISGTVDEVKVQSAHVWNEVKEKASELNEATKEYREQLAEKAKDAIGKIDEFVDQTLEKARKLEEEEKVRDSDGDKLADKPVDFGKSVSESKEDFFFKSRTMVREK